MVYTRRPNDKAYRRVDLYNSDTPAFSAFTSQGQTVNYTEGEQILEIQREDDTTELFSGSAAMITIEYGAGQDQQIWLSCTERPSVLSTVTARIWLRKTGTEAPAYKIPTGLRVEGSRCAFRVCGGTGQVELFGDKYFDLVYCLRRKL